MTSTSVTSAEKTVSEPARQIEVADVTDVVVVGGGPAGVAAAIAAGRSGAKTVLVERYGHLGGMATGGLVILIPHLSDGFKGQQVVGICQEMVGRLDALGAVVHPRYEDLGSTDPELIRKWKEYLFFVVGGKVRMSVLVDPEILKCVLNDMMEEAGVKLFLHSWGTQALVEENRVRGVIFESKSGGRRSCRKSRSMRQATETYSRPPERPLTARLIRRPGFPGWLWFFRLRTSTPRGSADS